MTVREVLAASREAAVELRLIREQAEIRLQSIGVQGHNSFEVHAKTGILDPMRHVIELMDWEADITDVDRLKDPIAEAQDIVRGIGRIADPLTMELVTRYYLHGESWREIVDGNSATGVAPIAERADALAGVQRSKQFEWLSKAMDEAIGQWERIGIAHLKEMGRS